MTVKLYPHQEKALKEMSNGKILWGGTGVGKTLTAAAYYMAKEHDRDVYVLTTAKKRDDLDWEKEFIQFGIGTKREGTVGGILKVDSWNNVYKYTEVKDAFFIFDEQRVVGSGMWAKSFIRISKSNHWILLSATPGDTWLDYIPVFVANGFYKNRTQFKREHVVYSPYSKFPKVERYLGVNKLLKLRDQLLVEMPYHSHTKRVTHEVEVDHDVDLLKKVVKERWHVYENRPLRNVAEMFLVMRKVVNSSPSRLEAMVELLGRHPKVIVFYNFDYELEILRTLTKERIESWQTQKPVDTTSLPPLPDGLSRGTANGSVSVADLSSPLRSKKQKITNSTSTTTSGSTFQLAEWNGHKHEPIPTTDRWVYLVQYSAGAEGWNCVETDAMIFWSLPYSYKLFHQAHGRIDRLNTPFTDLHYYIFSSKAWVDVAIKKALSMKKAFNESKYTVKEIV